MSTTQVVVEKKLNHQANIVRITSTHKHNNADLLELVNVNGYQAVVQKGDFLPDDLAVYIQPDSIVPQTEPFRFIWENYIGLDGLVPEKRRRITVRKFRGEWSEGLLLPISEFEEEFLQAAANTGNVSFEPGTDVSDIIGVTHYDPDAGTEGEAALIHAPRRKYPKTLKGWVWYILHRLGFQRATAGFALEVGFKIPVYDVEAYKNHMGVLVHGETVLVTEKIHGSNARFVFLDDVMYAGSRTQWKAPGGNDVWNKALANIPWIEQWCRTHPGAALYGEITPTQKGFKYGSEDVQFFLFDIRTPEGNWVPLGEYIAWDIYSPSERMVPIYYLGPYSEDLIRSMVDGPSMVVGAKNIREGVVVKAATDRRAFGLGRVQLKYVSNAFLEKDSKL
jgi:hypothetical protein